MSGTTYSRSPGTAILPETWAAVLARHRGHALDPRERLSWDEASEGEREAFTCMASAALTIPPDFLRFNLTHAPFPGGYYPGSVPEPEGFPANGYIEGLSFERALSALGLANATTLRDVLTAFHGPARVVKLLPGETIYRTVGLTSASARHGAVTNALLGAYWEPTCPSRYTSLERWRQTMAVLGEWNGGCSYLEVELDAELTVLSGKVGMRYVDTDKRFVLPGGGDQYFIPDVGRQLPDLADWVRRTPLATLLKQTLFGSVER